MLTDVALQIWKDKVLQASSGIWDLLGYISNALAYMVNVAGTEWDPSHPVNDVEQLEVGLR